MIFTGVQKQTIDAIIAFYDAHPFSQPSYSQQRHLRSIYTETEYGLRFLPFVLETIKKSHTTLPYILRQQYADSQLIFECALKVPPSVATGNIESYCFDFWARLATHTTPAYFHAVTKYLIIPPLKKFGYFSPTMIVILFSALVLHLGETYEHASYGLVWKTFVKRKYPHAYVESLCKSPQLSSDLIIAQVATERTSWIQTHI
jgi:hypothetical protein